MFLVTLSGWDRCSSFGGRGVASFLGRLVLGVFVLVGGLVVGGCGDLAVREDEKWFFDVDWATVTPAEVERMILAGELDPVEEYVVYAKDLDGVPRKTIWFPLAELARAGGDPDVADVLVAHGADVNGIVFEHDWVTPLDVAARMGNADMVRRLFALGVSIESLGERDMPAILQTLGNRDMPVDVKKETIGALIDGGVDINLVARKVKTDFYNTPLIYALSLVDGEDTGNYLGVISYMISRGADVNANPKGSITPMHVAVIKQKIDFAKLLVESGADVNASIDQCISPLVMFVLNGHNMEVFDYLLAEGADIDVKCSNSKESDLLDFVRERRGGKLAKKAYEQSPASNKMSFTEWRFVADRIESRLERICRVEDYDICGRMEIAS